MEDTRQEEIEREEVDDEIETNSDGVRMRFDGDPASLLQALEALSNQSGGGLPEALRGKLSTSNPSSFVVDMDPSLFHIGLLGQMQMAASGDNTTIPAGESVFPFAQLLNPGNSRFQHLLEGIKSSAPVEKQMVCLSELSTKMAMSSEQVLLISGFNPEAFASAIVEIICAPANMEVLLVAARSLASLLELFPRRAIPRAISSGIVPALCQKLLEIEYMDVAELSFRILAQISSWKPPSTSESTEAIATTVAANRKAIIRGNGFIALLQFIDFFPIVIQRTAAQITSQLCVNFPMECFSFLENGMPFILNLLQSSDSELFHHACEAFKNLAESKSFSDKIPGSTRSLASQIVSEDLCNALLNYLQTGIDGEKRILSSTSIASFRFFACLLSSPNGKKAISWQKLSPIVLNHLNKQVGANGSTGAVLDGPMLKEILRLVVVLLGTNEEEEDKKPTDPEILIFISKLIPLIIRVFDSTIRSDLRADCLSVINRSMSFLLLSKQLPQETDLPAFLSRVLRPCKSKNDYLEVHLALQIIEQLFNAHNQKYNELLRKYGVCHALRLYGKDQGSGIEDTFDIATVAAKLVKEFLHDEEKNTDLDLLIGQLNSKDPLQVESGLKTLADKSSELTAHEISTTGLVSALFAVLSDFNGFFSKIFGQKSNRKSLFSLVHNIHEAIAAEKSQFALSEEENTASTRSVLKQLELLCQHLKIKVKARDDSNVHSDEIKEKIENIKNAVVFVEALARVETIGTFISKKLWGKNNDLMSLVQGQEYDEEEEENDLNKGQSESEDSEEEEELRPDETEQKEQKNIDSTNKSSKYQIELFYKDHLLSRDMSILEAIWKLCSRKKLRSIWNKKDPHVVEFRVIEGGKPTEEPQKQNHFSPTNESESTSWGEEPWKMLKLLDLMQNELNEKQKNDDTNHRYQTLFVNEFLCVQMIRVLQQPLRLVTHSLPLWCEKLTNQYPFVLGFNTRQHYFYARATGIPRAIQYMCRTLWKDAITLELESGFSLDNEEDNSATARRRPPITAEDARAILSNMERMTKIPRLKVRVARAKLLPSAMKLFHTYGGQKAIVEIEFLGEVGTGSGPTTEFYTLLCQQIQSKHLKLWKDEERSPSSIQDTSKGKFEETIENLNALKKKDKETSSVVSGYHRFAVYHCSKCSYVEIPTCLEHHQLLTQDMKLSTSSEEKEEVEKKKKSKRASKDKIRTASKAYCAACTIPEETSNLADPSVVCKKCSKDKEEVSEKQVKMSLKWWVLSNEEVAYLDEMYPHGESSILHPVLQCSHCETVSFPGTEAGLVEMKGPWMISKGGQRMTERDYRAVSKHIVSLCEGTPLKQTKCLLRPEHINLLVAGIKNSPEVQESQVEAFGYIKESNMASRMMSSDPVKAPYGLMPLPLAPTATEEDTTETRGFFNFLGRLMAQALLDQRLLNIPLSRTFIRAIRGEQFVHENVEASLPYVMEMDPTVGRSLSYLKELHVSYKDANSDKHAFESELNDMCLYFTLIGYSSIELIPNGKEIQVTIENVELFLTKTLEFLLESSFSIQLKAFQQGFNAIWHTDVLKLYDVDELEVLFADSCSTLWDVEGNALRTNMICDHGFTKESKTIHDLIEVLCEMAPEEQRLFIGFVTGANRLPVGGLSKLDPKLTVVRKLASDAETMDDDMLPSASTCTNYLKLPAYSTKKVLKERLLYCIREGQYAFHLS